MPVLNTVPAKPMHGIVNQKNPCNPSAGIERTGEKKTEATKTNKEEKNIMANKDKRKETKKTPKLTKAEKKKRKREKKGK